MNFSFPLVSVLFSLVLLSSSPVSGQSFFLRGSNSSGLEDWGIFVTAQGDPPSSSSNEDAEFIVAWNSAMIEYLGLEENSTQVTTQINPTASDPWAFETSITLLNSSQVTLVQDLVGDNCGCWNNFEDDINNATTITFQFAAVEASRQASSSEGDDDDDDDDSFGTAEIVGIVFAALLLCYCGFMVLAGIFYLVKAIIKKLRSREREGIDDSEDPEEMEAMGKSSDSEYDEESGRSSTSEDDESDDDDEDDSSSYDGKKESSSGNGNSSSYDDESSSSDDESSSSEEESDSSEEETSSSV